MVTAKQFRTLDRWTRGLTRTSCAWAATPMRPRSVPMPVEYRYRSAPRDRVVTFAAEVRRRFVVLGALPLLAHAIASAAAALPEYAVQSARLSAPAQATRATALAAADW